MYALATPKQQATNNNGRHGRTSLDRTLASNEPGTDYGLSRPGSILQIAATVVRDNHLGVKGMAIALGKKSNVLSNELNGQDRHKLGLIDSINSSMIAGDYSVVMEWARLGGLAVVHLPPIGLVDDIELMTTFSQFMKEVGDVAEQFNITMADRKVTAPEMVAMNKEIRDVVQSLFTFSAHLETLIED